jgi:outer membrane protein assembly factor BamB/predicted negative regulator of RcsB-dependent stress response
MGALRRVLSPAFAGLLALLLTPALGVPDEPATADKKDDKQAKLLRPLLMRPAFNQKLEERRPGDSATLFPLLTSPPPVFDQQVDRPKDKPEKEVTTFALPVDKNLVAQLAAAADYIEAKEWVEATRALQKLLTREEDKLLPPAGKGAGTWTSARAEALRLLAGLPAEGREFYRLTYGPQADALLKAALKDNKPDQLARVAADYLYTDAGPRALAALAARAAEGKHDGHAALYYGQLLRHRGVTRWAPAELLQATRAFRRVGDRDRADVTGGELLSRVGREGLRIGKTKYDREALAKELARMGPPPVRDEWPMYGGNAARSDQGLGGPPFMGIKWKQPTVQTDETARYLKQAEKHLRDRKQPVLPAFYPITVVVTANGQRLPEVIFRSFWGIHAVHAKRGKLFWDSPSSWSLDRTLARGSDARKIRAMSNWLNYYINQNVGPQIVFENSVLGSLSTDGTLVYAVDDLAVPPPLGDHTDDNPAVNYGAEVKDAIQCNRLQASDLATHGKLKWELGGRGNGALEDTFFLGAPLPVQGRLYVLTQKDKDLRLTVLEPKSGKLLAQHKLATMGLPLTKDPIRRTQAAHLAYSEGVLVCPTNAGAVIGFDLLAGRIAWAYSYAGPTDKPVAPPAGRRRRGIPPGFMMLPDGRIAPIAGPRSGWKVTAPMIAGGKVVFTAPDANAVHCLNLADGSLAWSHKRGEDDLYLGGVFAGRVLIVGKKSVRGLGLARGETLWTLETGLPSGQGVASDNVYYLPLREGARSKEPEVCAIDVRRGVIAAHTRSRKRADQEKADAPGNLVFFEGDVISQTATEIVAYPQLKVKLARVDEGLSKDPADLALLVERAELRLDKGDLAGAAADLRKAVAGLPAGRDRDRVRALLYQTLTDGLQRDFNAFEKYLAEYEALSKGVEDKEEVRRRLSHYYLLVGKGREAQGKVVEALKAYLTLAELGPSDELVRLPDEPAVRLRRDVWARGRIGELFLKATPEQRKQLEEEIGRRRKALQGRKDGAGLRGFVAAFGTETAVGREARLELARQLIEKRDYAAADQLLQELRRQRADATLAARAVLELARLATRRSLLADAVHYYRILAKDFAQTEVEGKKAGAKLFEELQTDKRFLPFLIQAPAFPAGRVRATEQRGSFPCTQQVYHFPQSGETLPFFARNRPALHLGFHKLQLLDAAGEERWSAGLPRTMFQQMMYANGQSHLVRFPFQNVGHLVVLPVGHMVFGIDPVGRRVLWEKDVTGKLAPQTPSGPQYMSIVAEPRDGSLRAHYQDGWVQRLGTSLAFRPEVLCLPTRAGLQGIDPLTGKTLWAREDVPGNIDVFADGRTVFMVQMSADDQPIGTRAFRLADGGEVRVPAFAEAYRHWLRVVGPHILLSDTDARDRVRLRLYDVRAGKDIWEKTYPPKSLALRSEAPDLAGAVAPDGSVSVVSAADGKELLQAKMKREHLDKVAQVRLLADRDSCYLACVKPTDGNVTAFGGVRSNLMPGTGLRALPVNGEFLAFNRSTGKLRWYASMPDQMVVLDRFEELPALLFASTYQKWVVNRAARTVQQVNTAYAIDKRAGKRLYANESLPQGMQFHTLTVDAAKGRVDLVGYQLKVSFTVMDGGPAAGAKK